MRENKKQKNSENGRFSCPLKLYTAKKLFLKISYKLQENTCVRISFLIKLQAETCIFIKKETVTQVFSCEFCEIFKNIFSIEHLRTAVSDFLFQCFTVIFSNMSKVILTLKFQTVLNKFRFFSLTFHSD